MDIGKMLAAHETISQHLLMSMDDGERNKFFAHTIHKLMGMVSEKIIEEIIKGGGVKGMRMDVRYTVEVKDLGIADGGLDVEVSAQLREITSMPPSYSVGPKFEGYFKGKPFTIDMERPFMVDHGEAPYWMASYSPSLPKSPEEVTDPKVAGTTMSMDEIMKRITEGPSLSRMIGIDMAEGTPAKKEELPEEPKGETDDNHKLMWRGKEIK